MLNINVFFEFKQRTRHSYSFQLAQLIYHSQHLNDYFTLVQNVNTESNRKRSTMPLGDPVSILVIIEKQTSSFFCSWQRKELIMVSGIQIHYKRIIIKNGIGILY
jgi:hypothetical protein